MSIVIGGEFMEDWSDYCLTQSVCLIEQGYTYREGVGIGRAMSFAWLQSLLGDPSLPKQPGPDLYFLDSCGYD